MFGKRVSEYLAFQWPFLALTAAVGLIRLGLSLAGTPDSTVLPLVFFQVVVLHAVAVTGILLAIAGFPNVFAAPEFSGPMAQNQWLHALAHLTIGMAVAPLLLWGGASLAMWVAKRLLKG
jgi:hypothetical protein